MVLKIIPHIVHGETEVKTRIFADIHTHTEWKVFRSQAPSWKFVIVIYLLIYPNTLKNENRHLQKLNLRIVK